MKILETKSIYYDDVNLISQPTNIENRHIPYEKERIFVSPMSAIVGDTLCNVALDSGYSVIMHRFSEDPMEQLYAFERHNHHESAQDNLWASIGFEGNYDELLAHLNHAGCHNILLDIANGYMVKAVDKSIDYINNHDIKNFMIGNIHSARMLYFYERLLKETNLERLYLRCGISSGTACLTAPVTGYNRGQITELKEICDAISYLDSDIKHRMIVVADGGISNSGKALKAFGVGADCVMLGGYWRFCKEAETNVKGEHHFYGGASKRQLEKIGKGHKHSEGNDLSIDKSQLKPFSEIEHQLWGGIRSGVAYSGYDTLEKFIGNGVFEIKQH